MFRLDDVPTAPSTCNDLFFWPVCDNNGTESLKRLQIAIRRVRFCTSFVQWFETPAGRPSVTPSPNCWSAWPGHEFFPAHDALGAPDCQARANAEVEECFAHDGRVRHQSNGPVATVE